MTRDEEVALVARIAADLYVHDVPPEEATTTAMEIVRDAEQAVDAKRGCERDWERLEAAVKAATEFDGNGQYVILNVPKAAAAELLDELLNAREALAALQPKERLP